MTQWSIQTTGPFDACTDGLAFDPSWGHLWPVDLLRKDSGLGDAPAGRRVVGGEGRNHVPVPFPE